MSIYNRNILKPHSEVFSLLLKVSDVFVVPFTCMLSLFLLDDTLYSHTYKDSLYVLWQDQNSFIYLMSISLVTILIIPFFSNFGLYNTNRGMNIWKDIWYLSCAWCGMFMVLSSVIFFTQKPTNFLRLWLAGWMILGWGALVLLRVLSGAFVLWCRKHDYHFRKILIVGAGKLGTEIARKLERAPWTGLQVVGYLDADPAVYDRVISGVPVVGTLDKPAEIVHKYGVEQIWLTLPLREEQRMKDFIWALRHSTVDVHFVPDIFEFQLLNHNITEIAGFPVIALTSSPMTGMNRFMKEMLDKVLSFIILTLVSPLMVCIAVIIKLTSPGPVFFKQMRHGLNIAPIKIWKFRTMKVHEEEQGIVTQATRDDPRCTRIGKFLRRTSLDELPQFINVLQGKMSIVGPRPHAVEHNEAYKELVDFYMLRHKVKPGITGWAQVNGLRGEIDTVRKLHSRIQYDLYYINNYSILLDIRIIFMTIFKGFFNDKP